MVFGIPNKFIVLAIVAGALVIPNRLSTAAGVVTDVSTGISQSVSALGSPRIEPVFNPTVSLSGNIGSGIAGRFFPPSLDDPSGEPVGNGNGSSPPDPLEYESEIPSHPFSIGTGEGY